MTAKFFSFTDITNGAAKNTASFDSGSTRVRYQIRIVVEYFGGWFKKARGVKTLGNLQNVGGRTNDSRANCLILRHLNNRTIHTGGVDIKNSKSCGRHADIISQN